MLGTGVDAVRCLQELCQLHILEGFDVQVRALADVFIILCCYF